MRDRVHLLHCLVSGILLFSLGGCMLFTPPLQPTMPVVTAVPTRTLSRSTATSTPALPVPTETNPPVRSPALYATAPVANLPAFDPTPEPTILVTPGAFPLVSSYQFLDAQTALATVWPKFDQNNTPVPGSFRLLRSTDGARTWQDITPAGVVNGSLTGILNASIFWVKSPPVDQFTGKDTLYRTTDGGQTWKKILAPFVMAGIYMVDEQNGWAVANPAGCGAGSCWVQLYSTTDGGLTWTPHQPQPPLHVESVFSETTISMASTEDFQFTAPDVLWFGGGSIDYGTPDLLVSRDRGQTWKSISIPLPESLRLEYLRLPVFLNKNDGFLTVTVSPVEFPAPVDRRLTAIFATTDGGRTWSMRPPVEFGGWNPSVQFVTPNDWFASCKGALCRTNDGGQTWQAFPLPVIPGATDFAVIRFFDAHNGYAIARFATPDYQEYQEIYSTHDGGQTWTKLEPLLQ